MYSPNFRLPTLSERHPDGVLHASERKNREEERQDRELGQRVDRLRARLWAIIERSRQQQGGRGNGVGEYTVVPALKPFAPQETSFEHVSVVNKTRCGRHHRLRHGHVFGHAGRRRRHDAAGSWERRVVAAATTNFHESSERPGPLTRTDCAHALHGLAWRGGCHQQRG